MGKYKKKNTPVGRPAKWPTGTVTITVTRRVPASLVAEIDALIARHQTGPGANPRQTAKVVTRKKPLP